MTDLHDMKQNAPLLQQGMQWWNYTHPESVEGKRDTTRENQNRAYARASHNSASKTMSRGKKSNKQKKSRAADDDDGRHQIAQKRKKRTTTTCWTGV